MTSLIEQLQRDALDSKIPISELLRTAKVVAIKLDLTDFLAWIENELNGYANDEDVVPDYRKVTGEPKGWNPYNGWIPLILPPETQVIISKRGISQKVGELEQLVQSGGDTLSSPYPPDLNARISEAVEMNTKFSLILSKVSVVGILDSVRNIILDWSLKLEKAGIKGEGMSFSKEDKEKAHEPQVIYQINSIENFTGNMGPVNDQASVTIQQINAADVEAIKSLSRQISQYLKQVGLEKDQEKLVETELKELNAELDKEQAEPYKISKVLSSLRAIFEGVAGNVIAQGIIAELSKHIK